MAQSTIWMLPDEVRAAEAENIQARRTAAQRGPDNGTEDLVGVALSGGGVRSAAQSLGALQALAAAGVFPYIDYISSVSGGGYMSGALQAAILAETPGQQQTRDANYRDDSDPHFPFLKKGGDDYGDSYYVSRLRDYSNFLRPNGIKDVIRDLGIVARGFWSNLLGVTAVIFALNYFVLLLCYPTRNSLNLYWVQALADVATRLLKAPHLADWCPITMLALTMLVLPLVAKVSRPWFKALVSVVAFAVVLLVAWGVASVVAVLNLPSGTASLSALSLSVIAVYLSAYAYKRSKRPGAEQFTNWSLGGGYVFIVLGAALFIDLQPFVLRTFLDWVPGSVSDAASLFGLLAAVITGLRSGGAEILLRVVKSAEKAQMRSPALSNALTKSLYLLAALIIPLLLWLTTLLVWATWLRSDAAEAVATVAASNGESAVIRTLLPNGLLLLGCLVTGVLAFLCLRDANANSLHGLYRGRLGRAFVPVAERPRISEFALRKGKANPAPYPIFNATLNIAGSVKANMRARNAAFFFFSPHFSGSLETGFVATSELEDGTRDKLDCAAVMAISGAAVSTYQGTQSIPVLAPTLAFLNIRLGYWLPNPGLAPDPKSGRCLLALDEFLGNLDETRPYCYLTDGGHIENLGIYELLRRKCALIIAIDGEEDNRMGFGAIISLQRLARIDLGVTIDLPWHDLRPGDEGLSKVHCAIGTIRYSDGSKGILVYFKPTLTGDENDYVTAYKSRNPAFPHEATLDQFFSEEQFEAYRALAFHAVKSMLMEGADVAIDPELAAKLSNTKPSGTVPTGAGVIAHFKRKTTPAPKTSKRTQATARGAQLPLDLFRSVFSL